MRLARMTAMLAIVLRTAADGSGQDHDALAAAVPAGAVTFDSVSSALRDSSGDVVLLGAPVPPGAAEQLADAAEVDDRVATVSALALPCSPDDIAHCAERVRAAALGLRPALPAPTGPCVLLRRGALELVGWPETAVDAGEALAAFGAACTAVGLLHVLADDLVVPGDRGEEGELREPVARARGIARRALSGLSVTVDARLLDGPLAGSQVQTLALITALAETQGARLRVLLGPEPSPVAQTALAGLQLDTITYADVIEGAARTDVVHRPTQVYTLGDMALLRLVADRIVVTHHDSILFHNPAYFASEVLWHSYRRVTSQALAEADRIVFSTAHARDDALRDELVTVERSVVVNLGSDHATSSTVEAPSTPAFTDDRPFLLCLGSDLRHKNRPFAIRMLHALRGRGWNGRLVLAGGHADHGSSAPAERALVAEFSLADDVVALDHVSEPEREWLMTHCAALVFASVSEGFGLPPFEAARRGVPCLFAPRSAMAELLPAAAATIVPWDADASALKAYELLTVASARARHLALMGGAADALTWSRFARELIGVYEEAARSPRRAVSLLVAQAKEREREIRAYYDIAEDLRAQRDALGPDALALVGLGGLLPPDVQRALLAAAARERVRPALFALLRAGYRVARRRGS